MSPGRLMSMMAGLALLSACGGREDRGQPAGNGAGVAVSTDGQGNAASNGGSKLSIDLPGVKGSISLPGVSLSGGDIDIDGVKLYPGSRVTGMNISGQDGQSEGSVTVRFDADASPQTVQRYFLDAFAAKGVEASAKGWNVVGRDHEGKPFAIKLLRSGEGTRGIVKLGTSSI